MPLPALTGRLVAAALAAVALTACLSVENPPSGIGFFQISGGNDQTVQISTPATQPLVVQTLDEDRAPIGGITVDWSIVTGTGNLSTATTVTGSDGRASVRFTASPNPGPVHVRASIDDNLRLTFSVTVVTSIATSLETAGKN